MRSVSCTTSTCRRKPRRGAAATEAAVVLPIMMTMAFAAVDFARVFGLSVELSNAVQLGAESGATNRPSTLGYNSWVTSIQNSVLNELSDQNDFDPNHVSVSVNLQTDTQGFQQIQVSATYLFKTVIQWPFLPNQISLQSQATMRQYR